MKTPQLITKFEHQILKVGEQGFTEKHLEALEKFFGNKDGEVFPYYSLIYKGVKFKQYVGILSVGDVTIEVLPKTDKRTTNTLYWRNKLIHMLSRVYKLDVKTPSNANQQIYPSSAILDIFIKKFLDDVDILLNRGLVKCYHKDEGNRKALKGKLLLEKHLMKNHIHKEQFYVKYTTYDREHILNQILREALKVIPNVTSNTFLKGRAISTLFNFPELKDIQVTRDLFASLQYNRKTDDYKNAIMLAELLLMHYMPNFDGGRKPIMALMFDMNKLWEEYIFRLLKRELNKYDIIAQNSYLFWENSDGKSKTIRPDIVITRCDNKKKYVIDTKWKLPEDNKPSDADLHQMFAYREYYNAEKVALLYPSDRFSLIDGSFTIERKEKQSCDMIFFPLEDNIGKIEEYLK